MHKKRRTKAIIVILVIMLIMLTVISGCSEDGEIPLNEQTFGIGDTVNFDGVEYVLNSVDFSQGDDWDSPDEGMEYVIVNVTVTNNSDESITYNELDWMMFNSQGQVDSVAFAFIDVDPSFGSGDLLADGSVTGNFVFEEPIDDTGLELAYYSNSLFDDVDEYEFKISITR